MRGSVQKSTGKRGVSWCYVIDLGRTPAGKRDQNRRRGFPTRRAAEEAMARELHERRTGAYVEPTTLTVGEYLDLAKWLVHYAPTVKPATAAIKERPVRLHLAPALGATDLARLSILQVQGAYAALAERLDPATVRIVHRPLRLALGQAVTWGLVPRNVAAKPPQAERREYPVWTGAQTAAFLAAPRPDERYGALWAVAAGSGLRRAELIRLRWADVDPERGLLLVRRARTKTRASARALRLPTSAVAALRAHRARQNERRLQFGGAWHDGGHVFDRGDGRPLSPRTVDGAFARETKRAGLPPIRLHDLRHGYATMLGRARVPVKTISAMLGHANVGITLDLYTHLVLVDQDEAVTALDEALAEPEEGAARVSLR